MVDSTNPKDIIASATKPPLALVPMAALAGVSLVMKYGAEKYGAFNWRDHPVRRTIYLEAALRHLLSDLDGETIDPESPYHTWHIDHAIASLLILRDAFLTRNLIDDRPSGGQLGPVLREEGKYLKNLLDNAPKVE